MLPLLFFGIISLNLQNSSTFGFVFLWISLPKFLTSYITVMFILVSCFPLWHLFSNHVTWLWNIFLRTLPLSKFILNGGIALVQSFLCAGLGQLKWINLPIRLNNKNSFLYLNTFLVTCEIFTFTLRKVSRECILCLYKWL